ncbi:MAG: phosphatidylserine decarboxylase family protein [Chitinophagales bacterium]|nr:phosphatidylserine decarboxylase family protein [Chitinophagales bacterium]
MIHKEGHKILLTLGTFIIAVNGVVEMVWPSLNAVQISLLLASILILFSVAAFFRIPKRIYHFNDDLIIAPADGKIVAIEEVEEPEYFKDKRLLVSIFMSPTNVHVNRNPISGIVKYIKYHPGKYLVAWHPKSSDKNERNSVVIEHPESEFEVLVRQIAGKLARRIVHYLEEGDVVKQNSELGFIKFGSRIDLFLPISTKVNIQLKQKVKGGKTVIGKVE